MEIQLEASFSFYASQLSARFRHSLPRRYEAAQGPRVALIGILRRPRGGWRAQQSTPRRSRPREPRSSNRRWARRNTWRSPTRAGPHIARSWCRCGSSRPRRRQPLGSVDGLPRTQRTRFSSAAASVDSPRCIQPGIRAGRDRSWSSPPWVRHNTRRSLAESGAGTRERCCRSSYSNQKQPGAAEQRTSYLSHNPTPLILVLILTIYVRERFVNGS